MSERTEGWPDLRCSDSDREQVADLLRDAAADGRLSLGELEERLEAAFTAKTYRDLEPITADLRRPAVPDIPSGPRPRMEESLAPVASGQPSPSSGPRAPAAASERIVTILSSENRRGRWEVPRRIEVTCLLGDVTLDFTESIVRYRDVVVEAGVVLGQLTVVVPDGADVRLEPGTNILGDRKSTLTAPAAVGGPVIHVRGFVVLGEISVRPPRRRSWGSRAG